MSSFTFADLATVSAGLLVARLTLGLLMAAHGSQKLFGWLGGHGLAGTGGFFEALGFHPGRAFLNQRQDLLLGVIGQCKVLDAFFPPKRRQIIVQILAECAVGEPEEFEMKPFDAFPEHLQFAQKAELS